MDFERILKKKIEISLIPLIDVSMFLLIFFMVAGTIEKFEVIPIDPPMAKSGEMMDEGHISILLGKREEIIIGDEIVDMLTLKRLLSEQLEANPNKVITLKADAKVSANRMIEIMDTIKASGGRNLSLATESKGEKHAPQ